MINTRTRIDEVVPVIIERPIGPLPVALEGHVVAGKPDILVHPRHEVSRALELCHGGDDGEPEAL